MGYASQINVCTEERNAGEGAFPLFAENRSNHRLLGEGKYVKPLTSEGKLPLSVPSSPNSHRFNEAKGC